MDYISIYFAFVLYILPADSQSYTNNAGMLSMPTDIPVGTVSINLNNNKISSIPSSTLTGRYAVSYFSIMSNSLTSFPDLSVIGNTLKELHLEYNQIVTIDGGYLQSLVVLETLDMMNNDLTSVPNVPMPLLSFLAMRDNHFTQMPQISTLGEKLTVYSLSVNYGLHKASADDFYGLDSLTNLYLYKTSIQSMPDFRNVKNTLQYLKITDVPLLSHAGVSEMAVMQNFGSLMISGTSLALIPSSCPLDPAAVNIVASPGQLQLCHCSMIWLKV